jgi:hypothetical protein
VPVALKVALFAYDPRFLREAELLARIHHPAVPELVDRGWWHTDEGVIHPYIVMEWVNGLPLYEWARVHKPTSRQVLAVLAQVAWALEVLHRADGLHRDVKGDNILVEPEGRAFLTDFGSGTWAGASPMTESLMPPGTREYRGPEALRFQWAHLRQKGALYEARPSDDLYALGVSAYRLVTGVYPPPGTDPETRKDPLRVPPRRRVLPQLLNARVVPQLAALIEHLLSEDPEARGFAREVAEAAEAAAEHAGPEADVPLAGPERVSVERVAVPVRVRAAPQVYVGEGRLRLVLVAGAPLWVMASVLWLGHGSQAELPELAQAAEEEKPDAGSTPDAGTSGLGETSLTSMVSSQPPVMAAASIALEVPDEPLPGQMRAPCRRRGAVELNGGCWIPWITLTPPCGEGAYEWKSACYWPISEKTRTPTSTKPQ